MKIPFTSKPSPKDLQIPWVASNNKCKSHQV